MRSHSGTLGVVTLFPLLGMLSVSFMPAGAASALPPPLLPAAPTLDNYRELFLHAGMLRFALNSLLLATAVTLLSLLLNTMAGYAFAKLRFAGRDRIFQALISALVIPGQVALMPLFLLLKQMGLVNTYGGVIVPALAGIFDIFLVRQYARTIPDKLLEAARVDGAGELRIFVTIVVPLLRRCSHRSRSSLSSVPVLVLFLALQKHYIQGLLLGSVKG